MQSGRLRGDPYGSFLELNLGSTTVDELVRAGVSAVVPEDVPYRFVAYQPPQKPSRAKPDRVFLADVEGRLVPVAVAEHKAGRPLRSEVDRLKASEQGLFAAAALGARIAIGTDGDSFRYIDVEASLNEGQIVEFDEHRSLSPAVLENLLAGDAGVAKNPKPLAETVWQLIWHATKAEPKECLLTFVEIFVLKFLSDNLSSRDLPDAYRFHTLLLDPSEFQRRYGTTAIEYYVGTIRPHIKRLFPDNTIVHDDRLPALFGLGTLVSKTSVINGFAFLKSSEQTPQRLTARSVRSLKNSIGLVR